jgi:hypothetical protein
MHIYNNLYGAGQSLPFVEKEPWMASEMRCEAFGMSQLPYWYLEKKLLRK